MTDLFVMPMSGREAEAEMNELVRTQGIDMRDAEPLPDEDMDEDLNDEELDEEELNDEEENETVEDEKRKGM